VVTPQAAPGSPGIQHVSCSGTAGKGPQTYSLARASEKVAAEADDAPANGAAPSLTKVAVAMA
jgi:hypothetical protein